MRKFSYLTGARSRKSLWILVAVAVAIFATYWFIIRDTTFYPAIIDGVKISSEKLEEETASRLTFFKQAGNDANEEVVKTNILNGLIDQELIRQYAQENEISVSNQEVQEFYDVRIGGFESEEAFLREIDRLYGSTKQQFLEKIRADLLREKVQQILGTTPLSEWLVDQREMADVIINL